MSLAEGAGVDVVQAKHLRDYQLQLAFSDGAKRIVDFGPFLKRSRHPEIRSFLQPEKFADFRVEQGDLLWGDYELCFPVADLYEGHI